MKKAILNLFMLTPIQKKAIEIVKEALAKGEYEIIRNETWWDDMPQYGLNVVILLPNNVRAKLNTMYYSNEVRFTSINNEGESTTASSKKLYNLIKSHFRDILDKQAELKEEQKANAQVMIDSLIEKS